MPKTKELLPVGVSRGRQFARDVFSLGWRSAVSAAVVSQLPGVPQDPNVLVGAGIGAGVANRIFRGVEAGGHQEASRVAPALLRDIESFLVAANTIALPILLNSQIGMAEKLLLTFGAVTAEALLIYGARSEAAHRQDLGG